MAHSIRFIGMLVVLVYVASAMVLIGMAKLGGQFGEITKTEYRPGSTDVLLGMSRRTKVIHALIFGAGMIAAFWPRGA